MLHFFFSTMSKLYRFKMTLIVGNTEITLNPSTPLPRGPTVVNHELSMTNYPLLYHVYCNVYSVIYFIQFILVFTEFEKLQN